jgi:2-keto-4-pentenoate hydratase
MDRQAVERIAQAFVTARTQGKALPEYPGDRPLTLADAYQVQDHALQLWDRYVGGWKVGKIPPPRDAELGANRLIGPIFEDVIYHQAGSPLAMPVFADGFAAAEAEFAVRIRVPENAALPTNDAETYDWVEEIRIGIEIASSPYAGINEDGPCVTVSDHGNNAGLVLGAVVPREMWDGINDIAVETIIDGETVGTATTASMLDGPFGAVRFLLNNLAERGLMAQAPGWVSSGAITGVHDVKVGQSVEARFAGIGSVSALITA